MIVYVGYVIFDYATAVCVSTNESVVKEDLAEINENTENKTYIKKYNIGDKLTILDCD